MRYKKSKKLLILRSTKEKGILLLIKKNILYIKSNISILKLIITYYNKYFLILLKALISLSTFIIFIKRELNLIPYFKNHLNKISYYHY